LKYLDFVDLKYKRRETDMICSFEVEPDGISLEEAAGEIDAKSTIDKWTEITTQKT